jgi:enoyl-CoA hydratase
VSVAGIRRERQGPLAVLRLDKPRGNALDEPLVGELHEACAELEADDGVRGVLLASAHPKLFCPGLDLVSLVEYDRARLQRFMTAFGQMLSALYGLRKPVVAAVSGHAVAGGCILAMAADWRVLRRGGVSIGLNEVKVGVPLPLSVSTLLRATVPPGSLSRVALLGENFADEEALAAGLADELAGGAGGTGGSPQLDERARIDFARADEDGFERTCLSRLQEFAEKDPYSIAVTKTYLRAGALRQMRAEDPVAAAEWLDGWFSPGTQARIRATVASLTRKDG